MAEKALFISYASEDAAVVQSIVGHFEANGLSCWVAPRDIPPRAVYAEAIAEAMRRAKACAVVVSRSANGSAAVKREVELASRFERPLIPIRIDGSEPGAGLDYYLNNVQWVDYTRGDRTSLDSVIASMEDRAYVPPPSSLRRKLNPMLTAGALATVLVLTLSAFLMFRSQPPERDVAVAAAPAQDSTGAPAITNAGPPRSGAQAVAVEGRRAAFRKAVAPGTVFYLFGGEVTLEIQNRGDAPIRFMVLDPLETMTFNLDTGVTVRPRAWQSIGVGACPLRDPDACGPHFESAYTSLAPGSSAQIMLNLGDERQLGAAEADLAEAAQTGNLAFLIHVVDDESEQVLQMQARDVPVTIRR